MWEVIPFSQDTPNTTNFAWQSISERGELDAHFESQIEAEEQLQLEKNKTPGYSWFVRRYPQFFLGPSEILELLESQREVANTNSVPKQEAA